MSPQGETIIQKIGQSLSNQFLDVQGLDRASSKEVISANASRGEKGKSSPENSQARIAATGSRAARMSKDVDVNRYSILSDKNYKIDELLNNPIYNDPSRT